MKVVTVIGARPQFIKAAVVSRVFAACEAVQEIIVHTGQHFDENMSDVFFREMCIPKPHKNLNINSLSHGAMTGQMLTKIEEILINENPDWVLVYGDTNSTLAAALAAKKIHIKVAHIEAGLRSFNIRMPEEINRILTDRISDVLFCPTDIAMENLKAEGYGNLNVKMIKCGDVMQDAAKFYSKMDHKTNLVLPDKFVLCTIHRSENTDNQFRLKEIFNALDFIANQVPIILPLHPRTRAKLYEDGYDFEKSSITFISPVGYLDMVHLLKKCELVLTDSGGLQKEAYFFNKNCVTLRDETEWVELVSYGYNTLAGSDCNKIIECFERITTSKQKVFSDGLYGNGNTGEKILENLLSYSVD